MIYKNLYTYFLFSFFPGCFKIAPFAREPVCGGKYREKRKKGNKGLSVCHDGTY